MNENFVSFQEKHFSYVMSADAQNHIIDKEILTLHQLSIPKLMQ